MKINDAIEYHSEVTDLKSVSGCSSGAEQVTTDRSGSIPVPLHSSKIQLDYGCFHLRQEVVTVAV